MKTLVILLCGGGSGGHLAPVLAVAEALRRVAPQSTLHVVCANRKDEHALLARAALPYSAIPAAKFPRGLSIGWVLFPFTFFYSLFAAWRVVGSVRPEVIFSKGGYVSVPVCLVGRLKKIPIVLHESDSVGGMANRLIGKIAQTICIGFPPTSYKLQANHLVFTGNPVRPSITQGSIDAAKRITGFSGRRPVVLVIGGSQGSLAINAAIERDFEKLIGLADIIHLTGEGKALQKTHARYWARTFVVDELKDLYALADVVVSRAGAGVLGELSALGKPVIVVPLRGVAQDHQQHNAQLLATAGAAVLLPQDQLHRLPEELQTLLNDPERRAALGSGLRKFFPADAAQAIAKTILDSINKRS